MMMQAIGRLAGAIRRPSGSASIRRAVMAGLIVSSATFPGATIASAAPLPGAQGHVAPIVRVPTLCDTRGCFTYGPRPSYHRPDYRPLGQTGPRYDSPRAAGPPRFLYQPQPPRPQPNAGSPGVNRSLHRQNCMSRYRSYNPLTDRYIAPGGKSLRCTLPAR